MDFLLDPNLWIAFAMLTALEIVLGVDNIIFISILAGKLPAAQRDRARRLGLGVAFLTRVGLLLGIGWLAGLTAPLFTALGRPFSGRDLVLLVGAYALHIAWSDGHSSGIYPWERLLAICPCDACTARRRPLTLT